MHWAPDPAGPEGLPDRGTSCECRAPLRPCFGRRPIGNCLAGRLSRTQANPGTDDSIKLAWGRLGTCRRGAAARIRTWEPLQDETLNLAPFPCLATAANSGQPPSGRKRFPTGGGGAAKDGVLPEWGDPEDPHQNRPANGDTGEDDEEDDGEVLAPLRGEGSLGPRAIFLHCPRRLSRFRRSLNLSKVQRIGGPRSPRHASPYDVRGNKPCEGVRGP